MAAADAAILVVSALPAEHIPALKQGGQAWSHLMATTTMVGIQHLIVAITKMDLVGWDQGAFDAARERVQAAVRKTGAAKRQRRAAGGVEEFADVSFLPLSGLQQT